MMFDCNIINELCNVLSETRGEALLINEQQSLEPVEQRLQSLLLEIAKEDVRPIKEETINKLVQLNSELY